MPSLSRLLTVLALSIATPASAATTLTLGSSETSAPADMSMSMAPDTSSMDMSAPPDLSLASSEEPQPDEPPAEPAVPSKQVLADFLKVCTDVSGGDPKAIERATTDGWQAHDGDDTGPYKSVFAAAKEVGGYGSVELWGSVETYPTQRLGYCRVDFGDYDTLIDFNDLTGQNGLAGKLEDRGEGNVYGVWETQDHKLLIIADRTEGEVEIEYNLLLGPAPAQN